jgi:hypothetical protein
MDSWTETQVRWLKKARAIDISKVFAKKDLDFSEKMRIQKKWLEIHESKKQSKISDDWFKPETWG